MVSMTVPSSEYCWLNLRSRPRFRVKPKTMKLGYTVYSIGTQQSEHDRECLSQDKVSEIVGLEQSKHYYHNRHLSHTWHDIDKNVFIWRLTTIICLLYIGEMLTDTESCFCRDIYTTDFLFRVLWYYCIHFWLCVTSPIYFLWTPLCPAIFVRIKLRL